MQKYPNVPMASSATVARRFTDRGLTVLWLLHMPKTGGMTIHSAARHQYTPVRVLRLHGDDAPERLASIPRWRWATLKAVTGHYPFATLDHARSDDLTVTVIRHPVDRLVSLYHHVMRNPDHHHHQRVATMEVEEFLLSDLPDVRNQQASFLAPDRDLDAAAAALETFDIVGTTESVDQTLRQVAMRLGWRRTAAPAKNRNPGRSAQVDEQVRATVEERNDVDMALYEAARVRTP